MWRGTVETGYVDLSRLAARNPAWANVAFYDRMIAALPPEAPQPAWTGPLSAALPPITVSQKTHTDLALTDERRRLEIVRSNEIVELTQRLAEAREYRLRVETYAWRREQKAKTDDEIARINAEYVARVADATRAFDSKVLNLSLQVAELQRLTAQWALSIPPAPGLEQARKELAAKEKDLATLQNEQKSMLIALEAEHDGELARAIRQGIEAVNIIRAQKEAEYRAADAREIERAKARLQSGMNSVLEEVASAENRTWIQSTAPPAISVTNRWPQPSVTVLRTERQNERARLSAERQRWVDYVYANTKLAAADIAAKRHWQISFAPVAGHRPGRDLTPKVAAALSAGLWKMNG